MLSNTLACNHCTGHFGIPGFTRLSMLLMSLRSLSLFSKFVVPRHRLLALPRGSRLTRSIFMASTQSEPPLPEAQLPTLSTADFKIYNSMAEHMDCFVSDLWSEAFKAKR